MDSPVPKLEDVVYKASHFCRHDFWECVEGASFSIAPYTGLGEGVRVVLKATEVCERGEEDICTHCAERWRNTNIKTAFEGVVWTSNIAAAEKISQYEVALIEAFKTAAGYGFMDGVMKLLAVRLLDVVVHGGLCDAHKKIMV